MDVRRRQAATDTLTPTTVTTYLLIAASVRIITMSALRTAAQRVASRAVISPRVSTRTFASTSTIRNRDPALGDYPDVPAVSRQMRKWNKDWWDQQEKANFGETLHPQDDILGVMAPDIHTNVTPPTALRHFGVFAVCFASFCSFIYYITPEVPFERRTFPRNGLADELGGPQQATLPHGYYDQQEEDEEEDDDE